MVSSIMPTYGQPKLAFEKGEGVYLYDSDGNRFLDFGAGIAVASLGHCHPHLIEALTSQAKKLWHCSNLYMIPEQIRLAERLVQNTFADSVFFNNSGSEAVELSIKIARRFHAVNGRSERYRVITCEGAFHGRSLATIAAGNQEKYLNGFGPIVDGFDQVPFNDIDKMRSAVSPETAAILVEPVQGEGGIRPMSLNYLKELRSIANEFNILLLVDEVQCGMGRTGKLFAHEWAGIEPDILATAKGLGGGFPVGACLAKEGPANVMTNGTHGSTFGGNPLAMTVCNAVLDVILGDGFLERVDVVARRFWIKLERLSENFPTVFEGVSGAGLMLGLKCIPKNSTVVERCNKAGLLVVGAGSNVVRMVPPLIVEDDQVDEALMILETVASEIAGEL
jgi:acetylornithine/N-succinyldiaminopimelate aminotransferase